MFLPVLLCVTSFVEFLEARRREPRYSFLCLIWPVPVREDTSGVSSSDYVAFNVLRAQVGIGLGFGIGLGVIARHGVWFLKLELRCFQVS